MIQELTLWQSRVTGELFESEASATGQDNVLLRKYNTVLLEGHYDDATAYLQKRMKADIDNPKTEDRELIKDLYEAVFSKANTSNRFYDKNPFELIWQLELYNGFNEDLARGTEKTYFDYKHASKAWEKENGGGSFLPPVNWITEKGSVWAAVSTTGGPSTLFLRNMDGGIESTLDGVRVLGKPNITSSFYIGEEEDEFEIVWNSAETASFTFPGSKGGIVTFNIVLQEAIAAPFPE